ncbi:hypothetical protein [Rhizobium sp. No.120]
MLILGYTLLDRELAAILYCLAAWVPLAVLGEIRLGDYSRYQGSLAIYAGALD